MNECHSVRCLAMFRRLSLAIVVASALIGSVMASVAVTAAYSAGGRSLPDAPLTASFVQGSVTWLVVPMGHLADPSNTFWQLFVRTSSSGGWTTATPPGVADNGGLVMADGPGGSLLTGFLPSQDLTFSPLSLTTDAGGVWTGAYFPEGLLSVPDAVGGTSDGGSLALGRKGNGSLLEAVGGLSQWRQVTTAGAIGRSAAAARCGLERLTAAAVAPDGDPLVGTACRRPGVVGLYQIVRGRSEAIPVPLPPAVLGAPVSVLRLISTGTGVAMLLEGSEQAGRTALVAGWISASSSSPVLSAPFVLPAGSTLVATGITPGGGVFVLLKRAGQAGPELVDVGASPSTATAWSVLPNPPRGTLGAAFSFGRIDAVTVHSSTLTDYALDEGSATWIRSQVIHVPIQYGSSS